jgi:hypothetical protein
MTKKWYESKTTWLGIVLTIAGVADFLTGLFDAGPLTWQSITLIISGVAVVVLRVWFTNTPIKS